MAIVTALCSSLIKVFPSSPVEADISSLSLLSGEKGNLQLLIRSDRDTSVTVSSPDSGIKLTEVKYIPAVNTIDKDDCGDIALVNNAEPGLYPDLLSPFDGRLALKKDCTASVWVEIDSLSFNAAKKLQLFVDENGSRTENSIAVTVMKTALPGQELIHINWFHSDCLAVYYGVEIMSEEYWRITENFVRNAVSHGVNCLLTPLFTPPLDTAEGGERPTVQLVGVKRCRNYRYEFDFSLLDRWVDMCLACGVKYFELSHLFTQWGAKHAPKVMAETSKGYKRIFGWETTATSDAYVNFLSQLGKALLSYTDKKGITDICFIHCSDEPGLGDIKYYKKASDVVRKYFGAYEHIDALSDFDFYKEGLISTPVPEEGNIEAFRGNVPKLWTYYCCGQYKNNLPNRFFCLPSIKARILGVLLYKYDCTGFLQWGFNFYFSQHSKYPINPFETSDAGGAFPAGDAFVVYPGENGEPLSSLRQKVFYDGFQDLAALRALEKKYGREFVLEKITEYLGDISFTDYPLENEKLLSFRDEINSLLG